MRKTQIFFLFLIVFITPFFMVNSVLAATPETTFNTATIGSSNFDLAVKGLPGGIKSSVGAAHSTTVDKINTINIDETTKLTTYRAYTYISVVVWSETLPAQAVTASKITASQQWLKLISCTVYSTKSNYAVNDYSASYENYINPTITQIGKGFEGLVTFNAQVKDLNPSSLDFGNTQYKISGKEFTGSLNQIVVMGSSAQNVGQYSTVVQSTGSTTLGVLDIPISKTQATTQADEANVALSTFIDNSNLGFQRLPQTKPTLQQGAITQPSGGAVVTSGMNIRLVPDVKLIKENLRVRSQTIGVDTKSGFNSPAKVLAEWTTPVAQEDIDRTIGWHVENYAIKVDLRLEFNLYSKYTVTQLTQPSTPALTIPKVQINDNVIASDITGDTGAEIAVQSETQFDAFFKDLWADYWYLFILIGVAVAGIAGLVLYTYIKGATAPLAAVSKRV
jgi:hypothetical protein